MNYCKNFIVTLLFGLPMFLTEAAAQSLPACEITVKTEVINATKGGSSGEINFDLGSDLSRKNIKIFISDPRSKAGWKESEDTTIKGLKAGFYDILIIDTSRKECAKQFTIEIKPN